jgi:TonB family protein
VPAAAPTRTTSEPHAARVTSAPDPRMTGRYIYTLAIQMPNVTSYSGSWIVWFAEHEPSAGAVPGDMRPPVALRKVDPKYIQAAVDEKVEGTVRLSAVIRKTGHVDSVELLQHLDARLDRSAEEALAKWEFEPAQRNGAAVDIDAVFEIPFRLAPKPKR